MRVVRRLAPMVLAAATLPSHASDFPNIGSLLQDEFRDLSRDVGAAVAYKGVAPGTALGILGFDLGLELTQTKMERSSLFARAGAGEQSELLVPKVHLHKGLFAGFDVGVLFAGAPDVNAKLVGADVRYTFVDDGVARPAVGVRLSGSRATGMGSFKVSTGAVDLLVSKKLTLVTPYAGAGVVRIASEASGTSLHSERIDQGRVFGGVNVNLVAVNMAVEVEKLGDNTSISAKIGWRF
jgi:hypothetical protein